jgi:hypothetical protein
MHTGASVQGRQLVQAGALSRVAATSGRAPLSGEVLPPGVEPYEPYDRYETYTGQSMLGNPFVLAGLAMAAAMLLAVLVVVLYGGFSGGSGSRVQGRQDSNGGQLPGIALTPDDTPRSAARSIITSSVRVGPSIEHQEIGVLRSGQDVQVAGRNDDATWFQIVYPANSPLRGWVPASALRIDEAATAVLPVVASTPISRPTVVIPTLPPEPTSLPSATPTVTPTPTVTGGPDLAISVVDNNCRQGAPLMLSVRNVGTAPIMNRPVRVTISTPSGFISASDTAVSLNPGDTVNLATGLAVQAPRTTATVDLVGSPGDANGGNNTVDCIIQAGPTPTRPAGTPGAATSATPSVPGQVPTVPGGASPAATPSRTPPPGLPPTSTPPLGGVATSVPTVPR